MAQYYLGSETYFCQKESKLHFKKGKNTAVTLDNLEALMMTFFIEHAGEVLSKDDLMSLWSSQYVMEHSLTRVISTLRKKLNDISKPPLFIKTVPRVGYKFIGLSELVSNINSTECINDNIAPIASGNGKMNRWFLAIATCFIMLIIIIVGYFSSSKSNNAITLSPMISEVIDHKTIKVGLSSNPNGGTIVYSALEDGDFWFLKFNHLLSGQAWQLKKDKYNLSSPVWRNNEEIIYLQWNLDHCSLRRSNIKQETITQNDLLITYCNTSNVSKGLAMLDDNTVLLSDSESISTPMHLIAIDLDTGAKRNILNYANNGHGVYRIFTSPDKKHLVTLSSTDWFSTDITIYALADLSQEIWHKNINYPLFSVALDDEKVIYKNLKGGLSIVNYLKKSEYTREVPLLLTRPIYSPVYAPGGFLFTEGEKYSHKIVLESLLTGEKEVLINIKNASAKDPVLLKNERVLYSSNQTGINQIWLYDLTSKQHTQMSSFDHPYFILNIAANQKGNKIAIATNEGIVVANIEKNKLTNIQKPLEGKLPTFWKNKLVFNRMTDNKNEVYMYDDIADKTVLLISNGAYRTISTNERLYYSKYHKPGIWLYQEKQADKLIFDDYPPAPVDAWNIKSNDLYIGNINQGHVLKRNFVTKSTETLAMGSCNEMNITAENFCSTTITKRAPNRLIKFSFSDSYVY